VIERLVSCLWLVLALLSVTALADTNTVRIIPSGKEDVWLELPKLAEVQDRDDTGKRWKLSGEMPVSLTVARKDFEVCLGRQGWQLYQTIPMEMDGQKTELTSWTKDKRTVLLMLSEDGPALCSWYLGEDL
jgi:hypothetical protein